MSLDSSNKQSRPNYLNTAEASKHMNVSEKTVRDLCRRGLLPGASQDRAGGPWHIPADAVVTWIKLHDSDNVVGDTEQGNSANEPQSIDSLGPPIWWERFRHNPWVFYPTVMLGILITLTGFATGLISAGADLGGARQQLQEWGILRHFPPAIDDETLILIAAFHHTEGVVDTDIHNEIRRAIQDAAGDLGISNLRVEVEPTRLIANDRIRAEAIGKRYKASMVIWGSDTGVRLTVNYLNLDDPSFPVADVNISETARVQLVNPSAYASFVTEDLPAQLTFLSLYAVGQSYYIGGEYSRAVSTIEAAIDSLSQESRPQGLANAYARLGWLNTALNKIEQAIADYTHAIALNPKFAEAYANRGAMYYAQGDVNAAIADLNQAITLDSTLVEAYINRGNTRAAQGDLGAAIEDFDGAVALDPNNATIYNNRGLAYEDLNNLAAAIADYDRAIALDPKLAAAYGNRGLAYEKQGDTHSAISDLTQAIGLSRYNPVFYTNRGNIRLVQGEIDAAVTDYTQAITLDPNDAMAYNSRGVAHTAQGNLNGAIKDFEQAIALEPNYAEAYYNRGNTYKAQDDLEAAIADFNQAITLNPELTDAYYNRGLAYAALKKLDDAITDYTKTISLKSDYVKAYYNRGLVHTVQRDFDAAITDFNQAITLDPEYAHAYMGRGLTYAAQDNLEAAITDLEQALALTDDPVLQDLLQEMLIAFNAR